MVKQITSIHISCQQCEDVTCTYITWSTEQTLHITAA